MARSTSGGRRRVAHRLSSAPARRGGTHRSFLFHTPSRRGGTRRARHRGEREIRRGDGQENDSSQYIGGCLGIGSEGVFGIEVHFQFRILEHPNSRYLKIPMPIPNFEAQYLHPNEVKGFAFGLDLLLESMETRNNSGVPIAWEAWRGACAHHRKRDDARARASQYPRDPSNGPGHPEQSMRLQNPNGRVCAVLIYKGASASCAYSISASSSRTRCLPQH